MHVLQALEVARIIFVLIIAKFAKYVNIVILRNGFLIWGTPIPNMGYVIFCRKLNGYVCRRLIDHFFEFIYKYLDPEYLLKIFLLKKTYMQIHTRVKKSNQKVRRIGIKN